MHSKPPPSKTNWTAVIGVLSPVFCALIVAIGPAGNKILLRLTETEITRDSVFREAVRKEFAEVKAYASINRQSILDLQANSARMLVNQEQMEANQEATIEALNRSGLIIRRPRVGRAARRRTRDTLRAPPLDSAQIWAVDYPPH